MNRVTRDFYQRFYHAIDHSAAHGEFCRRVFWREAGLKVYAALTCRSADAQTG